ncbi:uncharacterized protein G2W53_023930 [Senna tora]|uniref:Uncharacterized protein n=1 Tax=Senna tora TaxID=362788 RepID=A0A834TAX4_9FABA|nr:uncharacterized protein G2W53_023930 [Senna tora]
MGPTGCSSIDHCLLGSRQTPLAGEAVN